MAPAARPNARPGPMPRPRASAGAGAAIAVAPTAATVARTASVFLMISSLTSRDTTPPSCDSSRVAEPAWQKISGACGNDIAFPGLNLQVRESPPSGSRRQHEDPVSISAVPAGFLVSQHENGSRPKGAANGGGAEGGKVADIRSAGPHSKARSQ